MLIHWRLLLCISGAITISVFLARYISWLGLGFGLCFTLLALGFGIIWQSRAEAGIPLFAKIENPKISKPVAALGLLFIAAIWFGVFSSLFSPFIGSLIVSACFVLGVVVYYKKPLTRQSSGTGESELR
ncbi:MAG: hypothetical protein C0446_14355 [Chitinophaga sp.]|nr:hypothetical protein [Chitinophaga sp.]